VCARFCLGELTPREHEILKLIADGLAYKEIDFMSSDDLVGTAQGRLRRVDMIEYAVR